LLVTDLIVPTLKQKIAPVYCRLPAINIGARAREISGADQPVHVDPQFGAILKDQRLLADPGREAGVVVRVEHILAREIQVEVPIFIIIGASRETPDGPELLAIEQARGLRSEGGPVKAQATKYRSVDALRPGMVARASPAATLRAISIMLGRSISRKSFELCES